MKRIAKPGRVVIVNKRFPNRKTITTIDVFEQKKDDRLKDWRMATEEETLQYLSKISGNKIEQKKEEPKKSKDK